MKLRDLFDAEGTDKGCYAPAYETLLRRQRHDIRSLLEIGVGTVIQGVHSTMYGYGADHYRPGGSLRAWRGYFPNAEIVGIDIQPDTQLREDRIRTFLVNSTDAGAVSDFLASRSPFDVIIDDGSHYAENQLATLKNFFRACKASGFYFIEDIGQNSALYENPRLVEPLVEGAPYFAVSDNDPRSGDKWKMIVIHKML